MNGKDRSSSSKELIPGNLIYEVSFNCDFEMYENFKDVFTSITDNKVFDKHEGVVHGADSLEDVLHFQRQMRCFIPSYYAIIHKRLKKKCWGLVQSFFGYFRKRAIQTVFQKVLK